MKNERLLEALQEEQTGNWDKAHRIVQEINSTDAAWVHAYLHRVEGDLGNAAYWYRIAGRPECQSTLQDEWNSLFNAFN